MKNATASNPDFPFIEEFQFLRRSRPKLFINIAKIPLVANLSFLAFKSHYVGRKSNVTCKFFAALKVGNQLVIC